MDIGDIHVETTAQNDSDGGIRDAYTTIEVESTTEAAETTSATTSAVKTATTSTISYGGHHQTFTKQPSLGEVETISTPQVETGVLDVAKTFNIDSNAGFERVKTRSERIKTTGQVQTVRTTKQEVQGQVQTVRTLREIHELTVTVEEPINGVPEDVSIKYTDTDGEIYTSEYTSESKTKELRGGEYIVETDTKNYYDVHKNVELDSDKQITLKLNAETQATFNIKPDVYDNTLSRSNISILNDEREVVEENIQTNREDPLIETETSTLTETGSYTLKINSDALDETKEFEFECELLGDDIKETFEIQRPRRTVTAQFEWETPFKPTTPVLTVETGSWSKSVVGENINDKLQISVPKLPEGFQVTTTTQTNSFIGRTAHYLNEDKEITIKLDLAASISWYTPYGENEGISNVYDMKSSEDIVAICGRNNETDGFVAGINPENGEFLWFLDEELPRKEGEDDEGVQQTTIRNITIAEDGIWAAHSSGDGWIHHISLDGELKHTYKVGTVTSSNESIARDYENELVYVLNESNTMYTVDTTNGEVEYSTRIGGTHPDGQGEIETDNRYVFYAGRGGGGISHAMYDPIEKQTVWSRAFTDWDSDDGTTSTHPRGYMYINPGGEIMNASINGRNEADYRGMLLDKQTGETLWGEDDYETPSDVNIRHAVGNGTYWARVTNDPDSYSVNGKYRYVTPNSDKGFSVLGPFEDGEPFAVESSASHNGISLTSIPNTTLSLREGHYSNELNGWLLVDSSQEWTVEELSDGTDTDDLNGVVVFMQIGSVWNEFEPPTIQFSNAFNSTVMGKPKTFISTNEVERPDNQPLPGSGHAFDWEDETPGRGLSDDWTPPGQRD